MPSHDICGDGVDRIRLRVAFCSPPPPSLLHQKQHSSNHDHHHDHPSQELGGEEGPKEKKRSMAASGAGERWVGLATDFSDGSRAALLWAADNLLRAGDQLLLLHVVKEPDYEQSEAILWEATGSPLIPLSDFSEPAIAKKYGVKPDAETLDILNTVSKQKEVLVVVKVIWGDPREKLCQAINEIPMSCLVIGSRGLGKLKRVLLGSVSDYVVNNATCPVTVVKSASTEG